MPDGDVTPDKPRQATTTPDQYSLSIDEALLRYEHAGHPRTSRSIQRYCKLGELDCLRQETSFGVQYRITPESVARHIAQIAELASATGRDLSRQDATRRDLSRQAATTEISDISAESVPPTGGDTPQALEDVAATGADRSRPVATSGDTAVAEVEQEEDHRYIEQLEKRLDEKNEVIGILKEQLATKDEQIKGQNERARETNFLIKGLQELVLRLQPGSQPPDGPSGPGQYAG